jgi:4a-hydroxytetrahydrobiopterin dehydratase
MNDLTKQKCVPCEGGTKPFNNEEIDKYLKMTREWQLIPGKVPAIQRKFTFKDFTQALEFVNKVGRLANAEDHHPDIFMHNYKKVDITLSTHAIGGLSTNDFIMASKINQLV